MGKKNKKESAAKSANRWRTGQLNKKERQAMERFGLDTNDYRGGGQRWRHGVEKDYDDMREDFKRAARNDYDLRRTMEAAAMSGKGKAQKILDDGFKSPGDVMNAANFSRKAAEKRGVKSFTSNADYMGLTQSMVERDRRKFNEDINSRMDNRMKELQQKEPEAVEEEAPVELSDRAKRASGAMDDFSFNAPEGPTESEAIFGEANDQQVDADTLALQQPTDDGMAYNPVRGEYSPESGSYLDNYKFDVKKGIAKSGAITRGPGSINALF